jgi:hypothetical protein
MRYNQTPMPPTPQSIMRKANTSRIARSLTDPVGGTIQPMPPSYQGPSLLGPPGPPQAGGGTDPFTPGMTSQGWNPSGIGSVDPNSPFGPPMAGSGIDPIGSPFGPPMAGGGVDPLRGPGGISYGEPGGISYGEPGGVSPGINPANPSNMAAMSYEALMRSAGMPIKSNNTGPVQPGPAQPGGVSIDPSGLPAKGMQVQGQAQPKPLAVSPWTKKLY